MRKDWDYIKNFAACQGLELQPTNFPKDPEVEFDDSPLKKILDEIFSVDEFSGFPRGSIAYYLSAEGNPQVKQWLENNLLKPRMNGKKNMEGLTDDMIAEFAQQKDETLDSYRERLTKLYDSALVEYQKSKEVVETKIE